jgi:hypothetical protein
MFLKVNEKGIDACLCDRFCSREMGNIFEDSLLLECAAASVSSQIATF